MKLRLVIIGECEVDPEVFDNKSVEEVSEMESNEIMKNPYYLHGLLEIYDCAGWIEPVEDEEENHEKSDSCS